MYYDTEFCFCFHEYLTPGNSFFFESWFYEYIVFYFSYYFLEFARTDGVDDIFSDIFGVDFSHRDREVLYILDIDRLTRIIEKSQSEVTQSRDDDTERKNSKCRRYAEYYS